MGNQKSAFYTNSIEESIEFLRDCTINLITSNYSFSDRSMAMWHHLSALKHGDYYVLDELTCKEVATIFNQSKS